MAKKKTTENVVSEDYYGQYDAAPYVYSNGSGDAFGEGQGYFSDDYVEAAIADMQGIDYKFNERGLLNEMQEYIDSTYTQHYAKNKFQATEFIFDSGHAQGFCIGNILKYAQRYGKKGTVEESRRDLQKVIHYAIMALHAHDTDQ
tara:strand:- start:867 stop:1301 length:435 start_codon:yes stop_codon:yes gene_type:complete